MSNTSLRASPGQATPLFQTTLSNARGPGDTIRSYDVTADGQHFLLNTSPMTDSTPINRRHQLDRRPLDRRPHQEVIAPRMTIHKGMRRMIGLTPCQKNKGKPDRLA